MGGLRRTDTRKVEWERRVITVLSLFWYGMLDRGSFCPLRDFQRFF